MARRRNPVSDLEAVAAMPGLEVMADVFAPYVKRANPLALVVRLGALGCWGSHSSVDSAFSDAGMWDMARESARRVGRVLPETPSTYDQLNGARKAAGGVLGEMMAEAFTPAMTPLANQAGVLDATAERRLHRPNVANIAYADGTVFRALSDVRVDPETGEVIGSRSNGAVGPRMAERFHGKKADAKSPGSPGVPVVFMGVHGELPLQRVILGIGQYFDRDEVAASMVLFDRVLDEHPEGLHAFAYDKLMKGTTMRDVMQRGVLPIVDMPNAAADQPHVVFEGDLVEQCGRRDQPKTHAQVHRVAIVDHEVKGRACSHVVWALDSSLVTCDPALAMPDVDSFFVEQRNIDRVACSNGVFQMNGIYSVPCRHGSIRITLDLTGDRPGKNGAHGTLALADHVRPLSLADGSDLVRGARSDVESAISAIKARMRIFGRASALDPDAALLDIVGIAMVTNAVAWDVHASRHTKCGQRLAYKFAL